MMKDPQIIVMDEPTLGIDPEGMRELLELIRKLSVEDGRTLLISSHQLPADPAGMRPRRDIRGGEPDSERHIKRPGRKKYGKTGGYLLELEVQPCDDKVLGMLYKQPGVQNISKEGSRFMVSSASDIRGELTKFLGENGYSILHLHQRGGDLDEIYRRYFEKAGQSDERNEFETKRKNIWKGRKQKSH